MADVEYEGGGGTTTGTALDGFKVLYNGSWVSVNDICKTYAGCGTQSADGFLEDIEAPDTPQKLAGTPYNSLDPWNKSISLPYYQSGQQLKWILSDSKPNFGTLSQIDLYQHDELGSTPSKYYKIYVLNNVLKIDYNYNGSWINIESYPASSFIYDVIPRRIIIALTSGGGSGGNSNWNTAGSGGGGGATWIGIINLDSTVYIRVANSVQPNSGESDGNDGNDSGIDNSSQSRIITLGGGKKGIYGGTTSDSLGGAVYLNPDYEGSLYWTIWHTSGGRGGRAGDAAWGSETVARVGGSVPEVTGITLYSTNVTLDRTSSTSRQFPQKMGGNVDTGEIRYSGGGGGSSLFGWGGRSGYRYSNNAQPGTGGGGGGGGASEASSGQYSGGPGGRGLCYLYIAHLLKVNQ